MPDVAKSNQRTPDRLRLIGRARVQSDLVEHYRRLYWLRSLKLGVCGGAGDAIADPGIRLLPNSGKINEMSS